MDDKLTIGDLKEKVKEFCEARDWDQYHSPKDLAIGIVTEASELLEIFRFKSESESQKIIQDIKKKKAISEEIADVLYFLLRFSQMYNIDLSDELYKKIKINDKKYPIHKSKGKNVKYTEL
jgi:NTP pyrophosphatase (non-canonical NTP hydrolase)